MYAISRLGEMLFFSGSIPKDKYSVIEKIMNEIDPSISATEFQLVFNKRIERELDIVIEKLEIEHVFRIKNKATTI